MASPYVYPVGSGVYAPKPPKTADLTVPGGADYSQTYPGQTGTSGNDLLLMLRDNALRDAQAQSAGARYSAQGAAGNDPSMAAWAGLEALLRGQGNASRAVTGVNADLLHEQQTRDWQQKMAALYHQWQMEQQQSANSSALWSQLAQVGGAAFMGLF